MIISNLLQGRASIEELEAENHMDGIPFGLCNREWEILKSRLQTGDEIWTFSSPQEEWDRLRGLEGIALVRDSEIVDFFITALN